MNYLNRGLDLALGRGGDQVAIKNMNGNVRFYGGKTDPMEKRTRVRARVISHALKDILTEGDKVIIMGHKRRLRCGWRSYWSISICVNE